MNKAYFAGGRFWFLAAAFDENVNAKKITAGYMAGRETVEVCFSEADLSYLELLDVYWKQIDPLDAGGQFSERGVAYQPVIFCTDKKQQLDAEKSIQQIRASGKFAAPLAVTLCEAEEFKSAKSFHQNFHLKNPFRYHWHRHRSGRDPKLKELWMDPALKKQLTPLQYKVTQLNGTEPPYQNPYWNNKQKGIYVDVITGQPLFSTDDQYDAGCGWPSFTKPIDLKAVKKQIDVSGGMTRTEIRSQKSDSHLGHVFPDGPKQAGGLRYCINSAALRFIPDESEKGK